MMIEVIYFEGCPNHERTLVLANEVLSELGLDADIREVEVRTQEDAERLRFIGSPSVRVDGKDIEPGAENRNEFMMSCRIYGDSGLPARELLVAALGR
jgi:hypothetical protein